MGKSKLLTIFLAAAALLAPACSRPKAPGDWVIVDTGTGDAFLSVNFVNENVGWLNGLTDRSFQALEENQNANANTGRKPQEPGKPPEDPLKANQGFEVLQTTDGGQTWKQIPDQFKHKIRSVWFVDPQTGWALTIDRDILHTADGGATWALQRKAGTIKLKLFGNRREPETTQPEQLERVYFIDARHGWAWGGGRKDQYAEQPGTFLTTVDGGQNWNEVPFPFEQNIWNIFFLDARHAWANTAEGGFYKTTDGGLNWTKIESKRPELNFDSIFFLDQNYGWVVGHSGRLAKTTDGGRTWQKMYDIKDEFKMRDIYFTDRNQGWAVGDNGGIIYTPDGGDDWLDVSAPLPHDLRDIIFVNNRIGWAVGLGGAVLRFEPSQ
ncbi:MAG TPA: YCF48-related protein [Blastocatellia bacterium]|nr:YCF48-related protein [Blastocatellia bacterium]